MIMPPFSSPMCYVMIAVAVLLLVLFVRQLRSLYHELRGPPVVRRELLTPAEQRFFGVLQHALPRRVILAQVSMGALLKPKPGLNREAWWRIYGKFSQKIVDFCIADDHGHVLAVIELDDPSHQNKTAQDRLRDQFLARGGYAVHRFSTQPWPGVTAVRDRLGHLANDRQAA